MAADLASIESEIRSVLTHFLPVGLEGVADAQARAAVAVVSRRTSGLLTGDEAGRRDGARLLRQTALAHGASRSSGEGGRPACGLCRSGGPEGAPWPCSVWQAAALLGLVRP